MFRKATILLTVICLAALAGLAGGKGGKGKSAADHAAKLKAELTLTDEQTAQVEAIFADYKPQFEAIGARYKAAKAEMKALHGNDEATAEQIEANRAEMTAAKVEKKALRQQQHEAIKALLTEEQAAKLDEMMAAHSKKQGGDHGKKRGKY